ncbi:hypothetical protein Pan97_07220 [Bremerella volcania]|uniref:Uncharacterized protein n=2 Tax=Bremerella volcania TaxID=2527984 RepID=A0A518C3C8_9BACT|nr:hypothetical protein Pan97_07220 [Bremerella volcania]
MSHFLIRSKNPETRLCASSGGFAREFLAGLLRYRLVDVVCYVSTGNSANGLRPIIRTTSDPSEILTSTCTSSVYHPVNPLPTIARVQGRCAATLLACHAKSANRQSLPHLTCKVELLCKLVPPRRWTLEMLAQMKVDPSNVSKYAYRYGEPPGKFTVWTRDNKLLTKDFRPSWPDEDREHFPSFCKSCALRDGGSDVLCCDPWRISGAIGFTLVSVRSSKWMPIIRQLERDGQIETHPVSRQEWERNNQRFYACKAVRK